MGEAALHRQRNADQDGAGPDEGRRRGREQPRVGASSRPAFAAASILALAMLGTITAQRPAEAQDGAGGTAEAMAVGATGGGGSVVAAGEVARGGAYVQPWISASMPPPTRDKLVTAFELAVARVQEVEECRTLFAELGADPLLTLATTVYEPADPYKETTTCQRALAFTFVGAAPTRLCRRFGFLSDDEAAMVVVHEALHHAGLTERPADREAMSAGAINIMVRRACGF